MIAINAPGMTLKITLLKRELLLKYGTVWVMSKVNRQIGIPETPAINRKVEN
jgi:hypothetical protein